MSTPIIHVNIKDIQNAMSMSIKNGFSKHIDGSIIELY